MSGIAEYQGGQSDLELASADCAVLLRPINGAPILTNLEDSLDGGLDAAKIGVGSGFETVGNWTKQAGLKLTNNPTINEIKSHGKGSPTALIASEAEKSITYTPQELKLINLMNAWGFLPDAVSEVSEHGGFTIAIPELPAQLQWQLVLLSWTSFAGLDVIKYWVANKTIVGKRNDVDLKDSDVITHGVTLTAQTHPALPGKPFIFGMCGAGVKALAAAAADGSLYKKAEGVTLSPTTAALTVAAGANHTKQLIVTDSNGVDRTASATFSTDTPGKATVSTSGLITAVAAGTANVTAAWNGFTAACAVTVS
ncbi:Ig-like domain-containing protein [Arthrobacter sp. SLBN-53]|uniref:Ig-like domain-containing protein n=1 Tax=Arthrobacter sp. SLBN-53 TaxID=2768412 RepID=UPI00114F90DD|nr:Ig-like domain-containing protein [Arthrobacter sp. SLBN-53]TQK29378.1 Ig-like protein group 2 [Arthrobacter sp. SLBN-53]